MTRQRTRLTINFDIRQHQISRPVAFHVPSFRSLPTHRPGECVSIGIGYRTTNAPFANDNHPRGSLQSLRSLTAATNYYPPLNPGIAERERRAASSRVEPSRPGEA